MVNATPLLEGKDADGGFFLVSLYKLVLCRLWCVDVRTCVWGSRALHGGG
jgi:hypothetical protein